MCKQKSEKNVCEKNPSQNSTIAMLTCMKIWFLAYHKE